MTKTKIALSLALLTAFAAPAAFAESGIASFNNNVAVSVGVGQSQYAEHIGNFTADSEKGTNPILGLSLSAQQSLPGVGALYGQLDYSRADGSVGYNGYLQTSSGLVPLTTSSAYRVTDVGLKVGKPFALSEHYQLTPYVQLGRREWDRTLRGTGGYDEAYSNDYYGVGVRSDFLVPHTDGKLLVSGNVGVSRNADVQLTASALPGGLPDMSFGLGAHNRYDLGVAVHYKLLPSVAVFAGVDAMKTRFGASAVNAYGLAEPSSSTEVLSARVGAAYLF